MKQKPEKMKKSPRRKKSSKTTKTIYLALTGVVVVALVLVFGLGGTGGNTAPEVMPTGSLTVTDDFYDFGRVSMRDGDVYHSFRLKNEGKERAVVRKLYTS